MKPHGCFVYKLTILEDDKGALFARSMHPFHKNWTLPIEYCPTCGEKSKVSHIDNLTKYPIDIL